MPCDDAAPRSQQGGPQGMSSRDTGRRGRCFSRVAMREVSPPLAVHGAPAEGDLDERVCSPAPVFRVGSPNSWLSPSLISCTLRVRFAWAEPCAWWCCTCVPAHAPVSVL